jgi:hypothetical protein
MRFRAIGPQINAVNLYHADHLSKMNSKIFAGVVNAAFARTDIFRGAPIARNNDASDRASPKLTMRVPIAENGDTGSHG